MSGVLPEVNRDRLFALFRDMVNIYSPSGKEDELTAYLLTYLRDKGLNVSVQAVDDKRANLAVSTGSVEPELLFLGHVDTVYAYTLQQYSFSIKHGMCRGLGTADMKGGCAALIEAFVVAAESGRLPDQVLLGLVVGEEESGDGTNALLERYSFQHALVAEPTDLKPCLDHYGYIEWMVRAYGYRRHAAMSGRQTNAIHALLHFLLHLEERIERDEIPVVMNIRDLHSSESGFAVPDRCAAAIDFHLPSDRSARAYAEDLRRFGDHERSGSGASNFDMEFSTMADGYRLDPEATLPRMLRKIYANGCLAWTPDAFRSHSDANLLKESGCSPVILGPGQLSKAHTLDEYVAFEQVVQAAQIYAGLLQNLITHPCYSTLDDTDAP